jgi:hypothetical protein
LLDDSLKMNQIQKTIYGKCGKALSCVEKRRRTTIEYTIFMCEDENLLNAVLNIVNMDEWMEEKDFSSFDPFQVFIREDADIDMDIYTCLVCLSSFLQKSIVLEHLIRVHFETKLYSCKHGNCERRFYEIVDLNYHMQMDHPDFRCNICKKNFISKFILKRHLKKNRTVHSRRRYKDYKRSQMRSTSYLKYHSIPILYRYSIPILYQFRF